MSTETTEPTATTAREITVSDRTAQVVRIMADLDNASVALYNWFEKDYGHNIKFMNEYDEKWEDFISFCFDEIKNHIALEMCASNYSRL